MNERKRKTHLRRNSDYCTVKAHFKKALLLWFLCAICCSFASDGFFSHSVLMFTIFFSCDTSSLLYERTILFYVASDVTDCRFQNGSKAMLSMHEVSRMKFRIGKHCSRIHFSFFLVYFLMAGKKKKSSERFFFFDLARLEKCFVSMPKCWQNNIMTVRGNKKDSRTSTRRYNNRNGVRFIGHMHTRFSIYRFLFVRVVLFHSLSPIPIDIILSNRWHRCRYRNRHFEYVLHSLFIQMRFFLSHFSLNLFRIEKHNNEYLNNSIECRKRYWMRENKILFTSKLPHMCVGRARIVFIHSIFMTIFANELNFKRTLIFCPFFRYYWKCVNIDAKRVENVKRN